MQFEPTAPVVLIGASPAYSPWAPMEMLRSFRRDVASSESK